MSLSKRMTHSRCVGIIKFRIIAEYSSTSPTASNMSMKTVTNSTYMNMLKQYMTKYLNEPLLQNIISKEVANILQKCQPSVYGSKLVRNFELGVAGSNKENETVSEPASSSLGHMISGISMKLKMTTKEEQPVMSSVVGPKWKTEEPAVTRSAIEKRTKHLINSILGARTTDGQIQFVNELSLHLQHYPESKSVAVQEGALRILSRLESITKHEPLVGIINEVYALLGKVRPLPGRGIRILSIDGGGIRGIAVIEMLRKLEMLTGQRVHEMFDFICGVSTGAILACTLGGMQKSCTQMKSDYIKLSTEVFTQSAIKGTSNLVWSHSYYNTSLWENLLRTQMGEGASLLSTNRSPNCPRIATVSAVVNQDRLSAYVFRNYCFRRRVQSQYLGGMDHMLWEAARASAAAPTYFEECKLGNLLHQDGGILMNNPTALALHEAKLLWPESPIQCIVSFGTGRTVCNSREPEETQPAATLTSWKMKLQKIVDSATDTEGVHTMLSDLLPSNVYFRFNPYLTEMISMSEIEPKKLEMMDRDVTMYLRRNEDKFKEAARALLQTRNLFQRTRDYFNQKVDYYYGFASKL